jgi:hypothetical protein
MSNNSRRNFIRLSAITAGFLSLPIRESYSNAQIQEKIEQLSRNKPAHGQHVAELNHAPIDQVKVAFIGLGNRGQNHVELVDALHPKAIITGLCDVRTEYIEKASAFIKNQPVTKALYGGSSEAWKLMAKRDDIDLIIISTPWDDHVPMALYCMQQEKHVAVEVPASLSINGCWALVDTAEAMQRHCMMLENVCYGDEELWILNMVNSGVFGKLTHAEAAYIHDLRSLMFSKTYYYKQWRLRHHLRQDGNLYPTHGLGPVAQYMNIGRGDRFDHLVSMSSKPASLEEYAKTVESDNEFYQQGNFIHGDMSSTLIKTAQGRTILVQHDVATPRPYNRINALGGTQAYHEGYPSRLSMNSHKHGHRWLDDTLYKEMRAKYKHPIWDKLKPEIEKYGGHGGMDFVQMYRLIDCLNRGAKLDMSVYDGVDWSVVVPLSKLSVELGSVPIQFPDFTRGNWGEEHVLGIME